MSQRGAAPPVVTLPTRHLDTVCASCARFTPTMFGVCATCGNRKTGDIPSDHGTRCAGSLSSDLEAGILWLMTVAPGAALMGLGLWLGVGLLTVIGALLVAVVVAAAAVQVRGG